MHQEECLKSNILVPKIIASACAQANIFLCFISSTGIYDGAGNGEASTELTKLNPLNKYHESKVFAEEYVKMMGCPFLIARVGWLFGENVMSDKNFILGRINEALKAENKVIYSDPYQLGNPTNVHDCTAAIIELMVNRYMGVFNIVNKGIVTRYEYIQKIYEIAKLKVKLEPVLNGRFKNSYGISVNEAAINQNLNLLGLDLMPDYHNSLEETVCLIMKHLA